MLMVILISVLCGIWAWYKRNTTKRNKNEPPVYPGKLPLIGHAHLFAGDTAHLWKFVKQLSYESLKVGGVISVNIGPKTIYVLTDPDYFLTVANTCMQKDKFYDFVKPWLGDGLLTATPSIWKIHRKLINPAFNFVVVDGFIDTFNNQSRRLVKELAQEIGKAEFDHSTYLRHNALETICLTAFGVDLRDKSVVNSQYVTAVEQILNVVNERAQTIWLHNDFIYSWSTLKKKQDEYLEILHSMSDTTDRKPLLPPCPDSEDHQKMQKLSVCKVHFRYLKENIKYPVLGKRKSDYLNNTDSRKYENAQGPKFKPLMDLLLELSIEKGAFSDRQIREQMDTIIMGGHDTSASVILYTMLLVGSYPRVQERIFEELHDVFGDDDRDVTKHDLSQLLYLEAVLKETMRFYPIAPVVARYLDRDIKLRNCTLVKGRPCYMSIYGVHRHPIWGPDAEEFKPERWLDPATLSESLTAFAAFSLGKRFCIGKTYAYMSMKITLAHVFRHYRVKGDHTKLEAKIDIMLKPVSGYYISIEKREK